MSTLPEIRHSRVADAAAIARFLGDNFIVAYGHCSTPENVRAHVAGVFSRERLATELAAHEYLALVAAADDGTVAGVTQLAFATPTPECVVDPAVELRRFYVAPEWHGSGLADALMTRTLELAAPRGRNVWLSVWEKAPRAVAFYRRNGFAVAGRAKFVIGEDAQDDWVMSRTIA